MGTISLGQIEHSCSIYGPNSRTVVWVQGCNLGCKGCWNKDLWPKFGGDETEIDSIIQLARHKGYEIVETKVDAHFAMEADEAFCCGTAAVISPIGSITFGDKVSTYGDGNTPGKVTLELYDALTNIQNEKDEDFLGWLHPVPELD